MSYEPRPIPTGGVRLEPALERLVERLAENAHDLWAERRMAEGWTYGPARDDERKRHPCLRPYAERPESEKQYDRDAVRGTILAMRALGYRIETP